MLVTTQNVTEGRLMGTVKDANLFMLFTFT